MSLKKKIAAWLRIGLCLCACYGWWGVIFTQYTMTSDTYRIILEDGTVQESDDLLEWRFDDNIYKKALEADRSQIRIKSKLWDFLESLFSKT
ncbi:MAG: hypothetical protein LBM69_06890 [Lachnospiraceae bacterium]|jgi:hypothetical protein|nr:hypothetical protein [Lachnospiraceae bacterium]